MGNTARERRLPEPEFSSAWRVSALVVWSPKGAPLIGTQVPIQSDLGAGDYTCTTLTGHVSKGDSFAEAIQRALSLTFWQGLRCLPNNAVSLNERPLHSKGKEYWWYLVQLRPDARFEPNLQEVQKIDWNCPEMLPHQVALMSRGRREMFLACLAEAIKHDSALEVFRPVLNV